MSNSRYYIDIFFSNYSECLNSTCEISNLLNNPNSIKMITKTYGSLHQHIFPAPISIRNNGIAPIYSLL